MNLSSAKRWIIGVVAALLLFAAPRPAYAQSDGIEYRIEYDAVTGIYSVYARSTVDTAATADVLTGQVTIKVPAAANPADAFTITGALPPPLNTFYTGDLGLWSLQNWVRSGTPPTGQNDDPTADYVSFDLAATQTNFQWTAGTEIPLFSFVNTGACLGPVEIMADSDPFAEPNSVGSASNNQIAITDPALPVLNDFIGVYGSPANCVAGTDTDGDGLTDDVDLDDDNDGIPDTVELAGDPNRDTDGDGIIDPLDLDSDNDGLLDVEEAGHGEADANNDGRVDGSVGTDGIPDAVQTGLDPDGGAIDYTVADTDGDGAPDFQDLDSDDDGINDVIESNGTDA
ncbi:MAG: hypothetical protein KDD83_11895, partial [Caldilineaceae bacterium]|nr:hypothetical protein [Caldilineaceae bacterium]